MDVHRHRNPSCRCNPILKNIVVNGLSSNALISQTNFIGILNLKAYLNDLRDSSNQGSVVLIISNWDGFSTKAPEFARFFTPYEDITW